jgi:hypothetical protein
MRTNPTKNLTKKKRNPTENLKKEGSSKRRGIGTKRKATGIDRGCGDLGIACYRDHERIVESTRRNRRRSRCVRCVWRRLNPKKKNPKKNRRGNLEENLEEDRGCGGWLVSTASTSGACRHGRRPGVAGHCARAAGRPSPLAV